MQLGGAALPGQTAGANIYNQVFGQAAQTQYAGAAQKAAAQGQFMSALIGSASGGMGGGGGMSNWSKFTNMMTPNSGQINM